MKIYRFIFGTIGFFATLFTLVHARGIDGGMECAACTVLASMVEQLAEIHNQTLVNAFDGFCLRLPEKYQDPCQLGFSLVGPLVIDLVAEGANADEICLALGACYQEEGQRECRLYKKKSSKFSEMKMAYHRYKAKNFIAEMARKFEVDLKKLTSWDVCTLPVMKQVCKIFDIVYDKRLPLQDGDGDQYSLIEGLRGASWRGRDCNDARADIHPGRKPELYWDVEFDSNCNGISGVDIASNRSYEELYCKNSGQRGVVVIGDSVGAHFHAPVEWFSPPLLTEHSLKDLVFALENELDWPQLSLVTGYEQSKWDVIKGPMDSIYSRLRERNRCNHRDYQNLAVNGDDSFKVLEFVNSLSRNNKTDQPLLIVLELVGNDVCNNHVDTLANMTTPEQMFQNLMTLFNSLNEKVPADSKVLIVGMADGAFLYQFLHDRVHPFGSWRQDLTYSDVYDWWNCLQVTPCYGWLNTNDTIRNLTTERAMDLSKVMSDVAQKYKNHWPNLEINYVDNPISTVIKKYVFEHGPESGWQLIETVDGFHPNQLAEALAADELWTYLEVNLPHYLGPLNMNNDKIKSKFGEQGGY